VLGGGVVGLGGNCGAGDLERGEVLGGGVVGLGGNCGAGDLERGEDVDVFDGSCGGGVFGLAGIGEVLLDVDEGATGGAREGRGGDTARLPEARL
jgi:hypothetical protein